MYWVPIGCQSVQTTTLRSFRKNQLKLIWRSITDRLTYITNKSVSFIAPSTLLYLRSDVPATVLCVGDHSFNTRRNNRQFHSADRGIPISVDHTEWFQSRWIMYGAFLFICVCMFWLEIIVEITLGWVTADHRLKRHWSWTIVSD